MEEVIPVTMSITNNLPLFVPVENIGNSISKLLDEYPVTPYLDSRDSLIKWVHFIHNKVNFSLGIKEITLEEAMSEYYNNYKPKEITVLKDYKQQEKYVFYFILLSLKFLNISVLLIMFP